MFKQFEYAPGYYDIIWGKFDKMMVRGVINEMVREMKIPDGISIEITRIHWSKAWQTNTNLRITISIQGICPFEIKHSHRNGLWFSNNIHLEIPFSEFRDYKLTQIL